MLMNIYKTILIAIIAIGLTGCAEFNMAETETPLEKNWGRSYETARYNQTLNPEAGKNHDPVEGIAGPKAEKIITNYVGCDANAQESEAKTEL